jgi:hypothetical protein
VEQKNEIHFYPLLENPLLENPLLENPLLEKVEQNSTFKKSGAKSGIIHF